MRAFGSQVSISITKFPNYSIGRLDSKIYSSGQRNQSMANTSSLSKDDRKKAKRASRKKRKTETPLKPRDYARGSKKSKVKKLARGQSKRG
jgi:hypothetical protein